MISREPLPTRPSTTGAALTVAASKIDAAARSCRKWERGGSDLDVAETAAVARAVAKIAIEAVVADEDWASASVDPETRRARLAYAAWLLLLAGTDEHGESVDLVRSAQLFRLAATN